MNESAMNKARLIRSEVLLDLRNNILPFWMDRVCDPAGGFYGAVRNDGSPVKTEDKGSVLNARILWAFSSAYRLFGLEGYRNMADQAVRYFLSHFIDGKYGGVFWSVHPDGTVSNDIKQSYATAFGIYGVAEHYRATGDTKSLEAAKMMFRTLQDKVHDNRRKGYYEVFEDDYTLNNLMTRIKDSRFKMADEEIKILRFSLIGFSVKTINRITGLTPKYIYQRRDRAIQRIGRISPDMQQELYNILK